MKGIKLFGLIIAIILFAAAPASARKGVIMTYYGTNNDKARAITIDVLTKMVRDSLPQYNIAEAYSSPAIIHTLESRGIHKPFVDQAIDSLYALGCDTIVVANCQLLDGATTHDIEDFVNSRSDSITLRMTPPLLYNSDDCKWLSGVLTSHIGADSTKQVVLVGHGTTDSSNGMYALLDYVLQHNGHANFHVGTIQNYPDLKTVEDILRTTGTKEVVLYPLLAIAGNHALKDVDGKWKNTLTADGYNVTVIHEGLLELPAIRHRILNDIRRAFYEIENN